MLLYVVSMATQLLDEAYNHTVIFNIDQKMCHVHINFQKQGRSHSCQ